MELSKTQIAILVRRIIQLEAQAKRIQKQPRPRGDFRLIMRAEAGRMILELNGYYWDNEKNDAYRVVQNEEREYTFDASTTDSTSS